MNIWHIVLTILMISVLALLHELGHFLSARAFSVTVNEFAIGMGPKLISKKTKKTGIVYSLRLFPIGGFVAMAGEDDYSDDENAFFRKPVWQRMIITVAGAAMNIITGFLLMAIVVTSSNALAGTTVVKFHDENVQSADSGLMIGDEIIKVDGARVHVGEALSYEIMHSAVEPIELVVRRDGELVTLHDVSFPTVSMDGITFGRPDFYVEAEAKNFPGVVKHTFYRSLSTVKMIWESLIDLVTGRYGVEAVSGPVGVAGAVSDAAKSGADSVLNLTVMISMNLGVFNLLPLPALDGGRLLFQIIELIRRKPIKPEFEGYVHFAGIVLLMLLMAAITFKDIMKLFV